jgi:hypothetical protein
MSEMFEMVCAKLQSLFICVDGLDDESTSCEMCRGRESEVSLADGGQGNRCTIAAQLPGRLCGPLRLQIEGTS